MADAPTDPDLYRRPPFGGLGRGAGTWLGLAGGAILAVMAAAVVLQVLLRFLGRTLDGIDEVPRYLFVWLVMLGAAAAMFRGEHTRLEYFHRKLGARAGAAASVLVEGATALLLLSLIRSSLVLVPNAQLQTSAGLGLPLGYVYLAVPVGAALMLLPTAWRVLAALRALWPKRS